MPTLLWTYHLSLQACDSAGADHAMLFAVEAWHSMFCQHVN